MLAGAGMVLLALQPTGQGTLWAGAVALYLAASSLLEPLRLEVDSPATARLFLPWPFDKVLWLHCLVPTGIVVVAGVLAVAGATALGYVTVGAFASMMLLVIPSVPGSGAGRGLLGPPRGTGVGELDQRGRA